MNETNLWKLFSGDIEGWVSDHCRKNCIDIQTAHWMMNYGYYDIVSNKLRRKEIDVVNLADEKAIRFRLNRKEEKPNPYEGVCDLTNKEAQQIKKALKTNYVALSGGIGDHIEQISKIKYCLDQKGWKMKLVSSANRIDQLKNLVSEASWIERNQAIGAIDFHVAMAAYKDRQPLTTRLKNEAENDNNIEYEIVCCWNAAGKGDRVSRWIRSVNFEYVMDLYKSLLMRDGLRVRILDISCWKEWERRKIKSMGISTYDPSSGNTNSLAEIILKAKKVISIDTALVHLCAAVGKKVIVLLPKVSDERWKSITLPGNSYKDICYFVKQRQWCTWEDELKEVKKNDNLGGLEWRKNLYLKIMFIRIPPSKYRRLQLIER